MEFQYSAGAFVYRKERGRILFLLLLKDNGEYDIPKGHIEKGESAEQAARRETREEAGIDVKFIPFFKVQTRYFFYEKKTRIFKTVKLFLAEAKTKNVKISYEHKGYEWAEYENALRKLKFKDLVQLMPRVYNYIKRREEMDGINREYAELPKKLRSWSLSRTFVPGEGRLDAETVLVGQAPGKNEDIQERPFVGRSGILLTKVLKKAGIRRDDLYITSVVQFFPPENRIPSTEEVEMCRSLLLRQLSVIKPKYVIILGNIASSAVLGIKDVTKNHGRFIKKDGIHYFITFHPAAALRFKETLELMQKDLLKFKAEIGK